MSQQESQQQEPQQQQQQQQQHQSYAAAAAAAIPADPSRTIKAPAGDVPFAWDVAENNKKRTGKLSIPTGATVAYKMDYGFPPGAMEAIRLDSKGYQRLAFDRALKIEITNSAVTGETIVVLHNVQEEKMPTRPALRTQWRHWRQTKDGGANLTDTAAPRKNLYFIQARSGVAQYPGIVSRSDVRVIGRKQGTQVGEILAELPGTPPFIKDVIVTPADRVFDEAGCFGFTVKFANPEAWTAALFLQHDKNLAVRMSNEWALRVWGTTAALLKEWFPGAIVIDEKPYDPASERQKAPAAPRARDPIVKFAGELVVRVQCLAGTWRCEQHVADIAGHHGITIIPETVRIDHFAGTVASDEARKSLFGVYNNGYYAIHASEGNLIRAPPA